MKDNSDNKSICNSIINMLGDRYPCQLKKSHKGKHRYSLFWTDKEARHSLKWSNVE